MNDLIKKLGIYIIGAALALILINCIHIKVTVIHETSEEIKINHRGSVDADLHGRVSNDVNFTSPVRILNGY